MKYTPTYKLRFMCQCKKSYKQEKNVYIKIFQDCILKNCYKNQQFYDNKTQTIMTTCATPKTMTINKHNHKRKFQQV